MRIILMSRGNLFVAICADSGDELGVGTSTDGALGAAVAAAYADNGCVDIKEITTRFRL